MNRTYANRYCLRFANYLKLVAFLVISIGLPLHAEDTIESAQAWRQGWPQACGPNWDFSAIVTDVSLVEQLSSGRLVWNSESPLARGKGFSAIDNSVGSSGIPSGGGYGPIFADGKLFQWHYLPAGNEALVSSGRTQPYRRNVKTAADMHLVAIDPADGKTLWRRVIPGVAPNFQGDKSVDPQNTSPCAADGRLFARGRDNRLYAFATSDGSLLWARPIPGFEKAQQDRASDVLMQELKDPHVHHQGDDILVTVAGRVFVNGPGLTAYDAVTGKVVWQKDLKLSAAGYPLPWPGKDGVRLLVSAADGLHCLDAVTGRSIWHEESIPVQDRLYRDDDTLVILHEKVVPQYHHRTGDCDYSGAGTPAAYRLSDKGVERLWSAAERFNGSPESLLIVRSTRDSLASIHNGKLYVQSMATKGGLALKPKQIPPKNALQGDKREGLIAVVHKGDKEIVSKQLLVVDLKSGNPVHRVVVEDSRSSFTFARIGDHLFAEVDTGHENKPHIWIRIDDQKPPTPQSGWQPPWVLTVPYGNYIQKILLDGRIFVRHNHGLACYDVRAKQSAGHNPSPAELPERAAKLPAPLRLLASPRLRERGDAVMRLGDSTEVEFTSQDIMLLLQEGDRTVRRATRRVLEARSKGGQKIAFAPAAFELLLRLIEKGQGDSTYEVAVACRVTGSKYEKAFISKLVKTANENENAMPVRRAALLSLGGLSATESIQPVIDLLDDETLGPMAARTLAVIGKNDESAINALAKQSGSDRIDLAYACGDALQQIAREQGIPAAIAAKAIMQLPAPGEFASQPQVSLAAPLAADALSEPGLEWQLSVIANLTSGNKVNWSFVKTLVGCTLSRGVENDHPSLKRAGSHQFIATIVAEYEKALADKPTEAADSLPPSYSNFWKGIDIDAAASGSPQKIW